MTREELETANNEELIDELNYCGYDSYYGEYRADIVAEIKKRMKEPCVPKDKEAADMVIKALEKELCKDCISREKAKQFLYERLDRLNDDELYDIFSKIIDDMYNELSSVEQEPKTGQWVKIKPYPLQMHDYECSECGHETDDNTENYCSNCGAKMESEW